MVILRRMGFCIHQDYDVGKAGYCMDERGLMSSEYTLKFWVALNGVEKNAANGEDHDN
jgi:hypothetical protein